MLVDKPTSTDNYCRLLSTIYVYKCNIKNTFFGTVIKCFSWSDKIKILKMDYMTILTRAIQILKITFNRLCLKN